MMTKETTLVREGIVSEALPAGQFRLQVDDGYVLATVANRVRRELRYLAAGERVLFETSAYDLQRGRIIGRCLEQAV